ncbi:hypothetical protein EV128_11896 [Rhizobium azibense]|nr:hypothetical protein EV128_11896 [Rhizobium azibense]
MAHEKHGRLVYQDEFGLADLSCRAFPAAINIPTPQQQSAPSSQQVLSSPKR